MSRAMNLKDSTLKRRRRSSVSGESHRDAYSGATVNVSVSIEKLPGNIDGNILVKSFRYLYHILYSKGTFSNYILPIMCVIGISIDPFFLFIPFVDDTKKCVGLDKRLGFTAGILRSLFDLFYLLYIARRTRRRFLLHLFSIDLLAILPLPQVVISIVIQAKEGSELLYTIRLLKLCVIFQLVPRFIAIYELVADKFDRATWARATFNLFLFILAGHVFGSFWYFFAIEREIECWKEACLSQTGCGQGSFYCSDILGDYRFLNGFCPTKTRDTTIYDFGIFYDALQSGVVEATDFPQKFLHCFLWGLKTLSSFGRNLQLSGNGLESFFATLLILDALVLFFLFIGNIKVYLQS
ncbi:cyclic nucleotide-gated ion channel 1-like isoform X1 [Pistacia vera]|uniref:cyclic nucleotide-gated ion channel 1-like isoform X1 n=1 Tax=Pistacia vera TaxID=55513 RepID=UPI0012633A68|nr:cyclic nucleotide-gated ion channel 1-like isoform X1 [Pistacia vera]XP_031266029.1 cyclic nucleotide-gated ion channel 1-like isoform X1 [Pistacia vera]